MSFFKLISGSGKLYTASLLRRQSFKINFNGLIIISLPNAANKKLRIRGIMEIALIAYGI